VFQQAQLAGCWHLSAPVLVAVTRTLKGPSTPLLPCVTTQKVHPSTCGRKLPLVSIGCPHTPAACSCGIMLLYSQCPQTLTCMVRVQTVHSTLCAAGRDVYVDIAGWHLFMRDMNAVPGFKMSQALATQLGPEVSSTVASHHSPWATGPLIRQNVGNTTTNTISAALRVHSVCSSGTDSLSLRTPLSSVRPKV
jgi:hypothetical protein